VKIVHVNTFETLGGAARSAYRLHQGLRAMGEDSTMFVRQADSNDPSVTEMHSSRHILDRVRRRIRKERIARDFRAYRATRPPGLEPFHDSRSVVWFDFLRDLPKCDILNLHWVANSFLDYESFFAKVPTAIQVVWTLHDMNAFTGGCHYDAGCGRFADCCGRCPQLGSNDPKDLSHRIWQRKAKAFSRLDSSRLQFVTPSRWLAEEIRRSPLAGRFPVSVIPYGLNLNDFAPRGRAACRDILGLPLDAKVLLFVADGLDNERKGFALLTAALAALPRDGPVAILSVGRKKPDVAIDMPWIHVGEVKNDRLLSVLYSAADIFIIPSLQDNLPNTVLEAMACGTPVLGFAVGGIPDMVRPGVTGMLVPPKDVAALGSAIVLLLRDPEQLREMGLNCRRVAIEEYSSDLQAIRYSKLYAAALNAHR
jgi:glycosyltransferase involved in cell wall biosynthesis